MTKSTITRERLEEIRDYDTCVTLEESAELARMALAAMDSEPVAWLRNPDQGFHLPMLRLGSKDPNPNFVNEEFYPVYAAPQPAPVVPGKWIPVSERMPEDRTQVILWDAEIGEVTSGHYSHKTQTFYHCGDAIENEITHWMLPPSAPQGVKP
ncbi:TPA: DUF551 domain-containing protein [Klebsiella pneumoniae]|uniref:DUF551 domain-containing protein n=1 Tax=Klebsiella pneumoniae TaxID=573 RepID=UPI0032FC5CB6|nr:DUF551 domain-containing protein [Klebsiella pneumoniae]HBW1799411.1 DUF551 domain-containing protein [Klebsiella pneumoniae]HBW1850112.1 DUF551 domain-containing protein [Klebsiella pneumoniae]HBW1904861.1 DUF551 domain-containing protein [Klebsiella pneumoniae]HBW1936742.1 DUF551 domain-containing protein [Klebsiella pneumoniae]